MQITKILHKLSFMLLVSAVIFSCKTTKINNDPADLMQHIMNLELEKMLTADYVAKKYNQYKPSNMKRSNKTLNQYAVTFNCSKSDFAQLQTLLKNDSNIKIVRKTNQPTTQSSKSTKNAKTKPIRKSN